MAVPVIVGPPLGFGATVEMSGAPIPGLLSVDFRGYDLLPDGRIVRVSSALGDGTSGGPFSSEARVIRMALNWFEELKVSLPRSRTSFRRRQA